MQTATESIDPRLMQQRLGDLGSEIAAFAAREQELIKRKAEQQSLVRREFATRVEKDADALNRQLLHLGELRQREIDERQARHAERLVWIQSAYHAAKSALMQRAQGVKDRQIGQVQGSIMRKRRSRQEEQAKAKEMHGAFHHDLSVCRSERHKLRKIALSALRSYLPVLRRKLAGKRVDVADEQGDTPEATRTLLLDRLAEAGQHVEAVARLPLAKFFRFVPLLGLLVVIAGLGAWFAFRTGGGGPIAAVPWAVGAVVILMLWALGWMLALPVANRAGKSLAAVKALELVAEKQSSNRLTELIGGMEKEHRDEGQSLGETFRESDEAWKRLLAEGQKELDAQFARLPQTLERLHFHRIAKIDAAHELQLESARRQDEDRRNLTEQARAMENDRISSETDALVESVAGEWHGKVAPVVAGLMEMGERVRAQFPPWATANVSNWDPPGEAPVAIPIGLVKVEAATLAGSLPHDPRFALPALENFTAPFALEFPNSGSLILETDGSGSAAAADAINSIILRLLAVHPPGRASFVFIDPVGLGKDFAGLMHLADYEETMITHRIWTQTTQIEERLSEINEHIEKVIQMYLRNEFANITEYNAQAGTIAEKYRFVVIAGFPAAFSDTAAKRLMSIASSGARCGVNLIIQRDLRLPPLDAALEDELKRACLRVTYRNGEFHLADAPRGADVVVFDPPPGAADSTVLVHRIGKASIDSNRVQVPFSQIAPPNGALWKSETSDELQVPIGRTGAKKLQMLAIGKGTRQHVLVAGKTGSGKSTLFHVIITNLALWSSPEQVEFYLVDFKKGVEFKCYAEKKLPHARVIAIESDREFALSVLQRLDSELKRRGELFRKAGSQDVAGYKRGGGAEAMPRCLLLIDEFQEFFTEDDPVAQEASLLLDRIVRQGRAFGIHVILGSQTLGGAYTLARATLGQMVIRIALQCNETDASLIMDDDNPAPRLLTRPGEGIYNDQAGALAANSPFQIVWLPEDERDRLLDDVHKLASAGGKVPAAPIVFEGNAPADIRDNRELHDLLRQTPAARPAAARAWLGAPNSIKGPTEALFQRQSGSHLLVVGQSPERSLAMLGISMVSLAAQFPKAAARFVILDPHAHGSGFFGKIKGVLPHEIQIGGVAEAAGLLAGLNTELERRSSAHDADAPEIFLIVHDIQRFKSLRPDDEFRFSMDDDANASASPSQAFANLLGEGGPVGMHVITATDTWNNVSRWIPRKLLAEFEMRVLFQMSANDSANLIDSPAATTLGLHRALFHNEHYGTLETFRPYAMPDAEWVEEISSGR